MSDTKISDVRLAAAQERINAYHPQPAELADLYRHLLDMLGAKSHEEAGRIIGELHGKSSNCTCPSGDGSLRWPCTKHPPAELAEQHGGTVELFGRTYLRSDVDAALAATGKQQDGCTESNCRRCLTHPDHRGDMLHAGIGSTGTQQVGEVQGDGLVALVAKWRAQAATHEVNGLEADSIGLTVAAMRNDARHHLLEEAANELEAALAARQPGVQDRDDDFLAGICVALQCVTAQDCGVLWAEIVGAVGVDDLLQYATFIEPEEWVLAGFEKYASAELGRRKPRREASKPAKASPAQGVDLGPVREFLRRRMAQWRSHLPSDPGAPGTVAISGDGEGGYNNDVRMYREGIAVMDEVLGLIDQRDAAPGVE